ncbi:hypothetical protein GCM10009030_26010 [Haloarcula pellucida]|uniref:DUF7838 domain-containing protein n=2 Tax=Haloarculaceae TaxID=1963268 RepID=A0A830GN34_9EURY|nr:hypothetical protein GCM10009030_26010 [Halomicroarcula pellucida]
MRVRDRRDDREPAETGTFNWAREESGCMSLELEHYCPECEEYRNFWKVASTTMHLGTKVKWHCPECEYGFVRIDGEVDTGQTA